jgi:hypothetical protein
VPTLTLRTVGRTIRVSSGEPATTRLLSATYGHMHGDAALADLHYSVGRHVSEGGFFIERRGRARVVAPDDGTFLAHFDEDVAIEVQKLRPDLYFVHAAVLTVSEGAFMLVTESGGGKSTLCWALSHHGYRYLSDELGPVDLESLHVHPFTRALMLKTEPPGARYPLPADTLRTSRGWHISADDVPGGVGAGPTRLTAIFFLRRDRLAQAPSVRSVGAAEAAARLYANSLNQLAHRGDGLDAAVRIATGVACFELVTTPDLAAASNLLAAALQRLPLRERPGGS